MRTILSRFVPVIVLTGGLLAGANSASADTLVTDFNDFSLTGVYSSWSFGTLTSGPDSFRVQSSDYGGGFFELDPNVDATGETTIELEVTINDADPEVGLGIILVLVDEDITQLNYGQTSASIPEFPGWFGLLPGETYTLTASIANDWYQISGFGADGVLDISDLGHFHLQIDVGFGQANYDVEFNNLALTGGAVAIPGDTDGDGDVDANDIAVVSANYGQSVAGGPADGDHNADGIVNLSDYDIAAINFGVGGAESVSVIPEPTTLALLVLAGAAMIRRR
jgi:hypothetical protein